MNKTNQGTSDVVVEVVIQNDGCHVSIGSNFVNDPQQIKLDPWKHEKPTWYQS